ncbi:hypothetical protein OQA88_309 [Cercophora sp. LCS_1]
MAVTGVDNDTRGWILCIVSGIACCFGATIICVDVLVRQFPGQKYFRIQDSNAFLACSLSLSFGVMLFSALYSMLPSAMRYLAKAKWDHQAAGFLMMICFAGGFVGIQIVSRVLHQHMPSHIVDCDHTHKEHAEDIPSDSHRGHSRASRGRRQSMRALSSRSTMRHPHMTEVNALATESTPLLPGEAGNSHVVLPEPHRHATRSETLPHLHSHGLDYTHGRRPSLQGFRDFVKSFVKDKPSKSHCGEEACFGYSEPCGHECDKLKNSPALAFRAPKLSRSRTSLRRAVSYPEDHHEGHRHYNTDSEAGLPTPVTHEHNRDAAGWTSESEPNTVATTLEGDDDGDCDQMEEDIEPQHHHHVPENAFLSIGLQTVIAITLHKFPEGFITYATNHASPSLGFNVFMALFVHNIAEGFSMALPLYLALGSRTKAIAWSAVLGGLSQPLGAGIAALWFKVANRSDFSIDNTAYACLFAITAGIMTSVALQLFIESLSLNHNRNLSLLFAFLGMMLMGLSSALVQG